jgi:hypothetical protein
MNKLLGNGLVFFIASLWAIDVGAQEPDQLAKPVGVFDSQTEYRQFMGGVKRLAYGENGSPELQAMIPMLNDLALDRPVGSTASQYRIAGGTLGLLSDAAVREDIEMLNEQYQQLQQSSRDIQKRTAESLRNLDLTDHDNFVKQIRAIKSQAKNEIDAVLLPRQVQRLKQIQTQSLLRGQTLVDLLTREPIKSNLVISDQQASQLRDEERRIERELQQEIAKLRVKARERLIGRLNPRQQAEVKELIGDAFEFSEPEMQDRQKTAAGKTAAGKTAAGKRAGARKAKQGWKKPKPKKDKLD